MLLVYGMDQLQRGAVLDWAGRKGQKFKDTEFNELSAALPAFHVESAPSGFFC